MNVAIINLKDSWKYIIKIIVAIFIIYVLIKYLITSGQSLKKIILTDINTQFLTKCIEDNVVFLKESTLEKGRTFKITSLMDFELGGLETTQKSIKIDEEVIIETNNESVENVAQIVAPTVEIPKAAETEEVTDRNFKATYNYTYDDVNIYNQSDYTLTDEMLSKDAAITNKKDVLIFHTHTCESYTPCETYNYTMTGNYRTTDSNYNIVRVGNELKEYLCKKNFNVVHNETYHDYPSYSGSYARSLETVENLLYQEDTEIVIDLHRDAMGNGDTYGPTIMVDGQRVAQLMFVIGTDGGGLEHPNWIQNLKIAIQIQKIGNQMYPGLFRPIIVRNSRYNQHVAKGASIIEVGATANTLGECLLSMQCLANVLEEVCK